MDTCTLIIQTINLPYTFCISKDNANHLEYQLGNIKHQYVKIKDCHETYFINIKNIVIMQWHDNQITKYTSTEVTII